MPCAFSLGVDEEDKATTLIQGTGFQTFFVGNDVAKGVTKHDTLGGTQKTTRALSSR